MRTLGRLYSYYIERLTRYAQLAEQEQNEFERVWLRNAAMLVQTNADCVAQCIARFGDLDIETIESGDLLGHANTMPCLGRNPWVIGLRLLYQEKASLFTVGPTAPT